jgi:hypothetical protein
MGYFSLFRPGSTAQQRKKPAASPMTCCPADQNPECGKQQDPRVQDNPWSHRTPFTDQPGTEKNLKFFFML